MTIRMKVVGNLLIMLLGTTILVGQVPPGFGVSLVVPLVSSNVDGNTYSGIGPGVNQPFTIRFQQVYGASEFAVLTNYGGGWLAGLAIRFRGDVTNGASFGIYMPSVQVNLSTTTRGPDELSTTFAENIGTNETRIFEGELLTNITAGQRTEAPEPFDFEIPLAGPMFFYDPAKGNLLLDVRVFHGNTNTLGGLFQIVFDAVNVTNDSVSRVYSEVFASTGVADTVGLPTSIQFWPNPKLNVVQGTNSITLWWPTNPEWFAFQSNSSLTAFALWRTVTNGVVSGFPTNKYVLPQSLAATTFYRLVSTNL